MAPYSQAAPALRIAQNSTGTESETGWSVGHMLRCAETGRVVSMLNQMDFAVLLSSLWRKLSGVSMRQANSCIISLIQLHGI